MIERRGLLAMGMLCMLGVSAQKVSLTVEQYQLLKQEGRLPASYDVLMPQQPAPAKVSSKAPVQHGTLKGGGGGNTCDCWIEPDGTYTLAMGPNDDFSSGLITIPFQFNLYGDLYTNLYINNNGNVSFDAPWGTFTATPFPTASFAMVAPFWGDVDTRGDDGLGLNGGTVEYKITSTALYVNWSDVGYFNSYTDKHNSFQLIITDGTDPVIGVGKNVSFCYKEMEWTTGDASGGSGGFGGSPAVVGSNRGNGVDFIQFGTFDQPGGAYDGPFGANDGIDWLDQKNFVFTTSVSTANIPPIASGLLLCDTLTVCINEIVELDMSFLSPETGQTTVASSSAPTLSNYTEVSNTPGNTAVINSTFTPLAGEVGYHTISYTATDDGTPPLTTTIDIVVNVVYTSATPGDLRRHGSMRRRGDRAHRQPRVRQLRLEQRVQRCKRARGTRHVHRSGHQRHLHLHIEHDHRNGDPRTRSPDHRRAFQLRWGTHGPEHHRAVRHVRMEHRGLIAHHHRGYGNVQCNSYQRRGM